jgi:hypothetical protein
MPLGAPRRLWLLLNPIKQAQSNFLLVFFG